MILHAALFRERCCISAYITIFKKSLANFRLICYNNKDSLNKAVFQPMRKENTDTSSVIVKWQRKKIMVMTV